MELNSQLVKSENLFEGNNYTLSEYIKKFSSNKTDKIEGKQSSELISLIENSSTKWNVTNNNADISNGLKNLDFESGLNPDELDYKFLRARTHALYTTACAHCVYFVGIANKIKQDASNIKNGQEIIQNSLILSELNKKPGLQIGIIGCGRLGRQLADALLEFSKVNPDELHISTRQPESLIQLKSQNVKCYFDNFKLVNSVNIVFLCVLPSQLHLVVNEIKRANLDKCIIYNLVRSETVLHLSNVLYQLNCNKFIIKPNYDVIIHKLDYSTSKMDFSLNIIESLKTAYQVYNPFSNEEESLVKTNENFAVTMIYSIINICIFLTLNKKETLFALKKHLFNSAKKVKIEEITFFKETQSNEFAAVNLVDASTNESMPFFEKFKQSKSLKYALKRNYIEYFEETKRHV